MIRKTDAMIHSYGEIKAIHAKWVGKIHSEFNLVSSGPSLDTHKKPAILLIFRTAASEASFLDDVTSLPEGDFKNMLLTTPTMTSLVSPATLLGLQSAPK